MTVPGQPGPQIEDKYLAMAGAIMHQQAQQAQGTQVAMDLRPDQKQLLNAPGEGGGGGGLDIFAGRQGNKLIKQEGGSVSRYDIVHPTEGKIGVVEQQMEHEGGGWRVRQYGGTSGMTYDTLKEARDEADFVKPKKK